MNTEQAKHPMEHSLKCWPEYFEAVKNGLKPFEIRKWDRPYAVGDTLTLEEWNPETGDYTGDAIVREITYVLDLTYLPGDNIPHFAGYAALGLNNPASVAALRAQQEKERQKPCKYCKMDDLGFGANIVEGSCEDEGVYITNNPNGILSLVANYSGTDSADIFYCPMCGRKLEQEANHVQNT